MNDKEMFYSGKYGWAVFDERIRAYAIWYYDVVRRKCIYDKYVSNHDGDSYHLVIEEAGFTDDLSVLMKERKSGSLVPVVCNGIPLSLSKHSIRIIY